MSLKETILSLRSEGKTYKEISLIANVSKSTIAYYCGEGQKEKTLERQKRYRRNILKKKTEVFKNRKISKSLENRIDRFQRDRTESRKRTQTFLWKDIIKKFGLRTKCYLTGREIDLNNANSYSFDHIIPVSKGGSNSIDNLGICIAKINRVKSDLEYNEFVELCKEVVSNHGYQLTKIES